MRVPAPAAAIVAAVVLCVAGAAVLYAKVSGTAAAPEPFACRPAQLSTGRPVGLEGGISDYYRNALNVLGRQQRVVIRQRLCNRAVETLRYIAPERLQYAEVSNMGFNVAGKWRTMRNPTETQIGSRVGYTTHLRRQLWPGVAATAEALLLPGYRPGPFYSMYQNHILHAIRFSHRRDSRRVGATYKTFIVITIMARGLPLDLCAPGALCPAPDPDTVRNSRYLGQLSVDAASRKPVSYVSWISLAGADPNKAVYSPYRMLQQTTFSYGEPFTIDFVPG